MALDSYSGLQTAIADFLNRDDMTAIIPTFIDLAEAELSARVRHWRMETRATASTSTQYNDPPDGWMETLRMSVSTGNGYRPLRHLSQMDMMNRRYENAGAVGEPSGFAFTDGQIELYPAPDEAYTIETVYYKRPDALSDSVVSNWILAYFPAAYLYGALKHASPYLQEDARIQTWAALFEEAVAAIDRDNAKKDVSSGLRVRMNVV